MKTFPVIAAVLVIAAASPFNVQAHGKHSDQMSDCDMKGMDMSQMTAADQQKMMDQCAAQKKAKACDMTGMDMSKMSAEDQQKMMAGCPATPTPPAPKGGS